jgi:hypothetical protein
MAMLSKSPKGVIDSRYYEILAEQNFAGGFLSEKKRSANCNYWYRSGASISITANERLSSTSSNDTATNHTTNNNATASPSKDVQGLHNPDSYSP